MMKTLATSNEFGSRQLRTSLLDYMTSDLFLPDVPVSEEEIDGLFIQASAPL